jgi:hypothetical protein
VVVAVVGVVVVVVVNESVVVASSTRIDTTPLGLVAPLSFSVEENHPLDWNWFPGKNRDHMEYSNLANGWNATVCLP